LKRMIREKDVGYTKNSQFSPCIDEQSNQLYWLTGRTTSNCFKTTEAFQVYGMKLNRSGFDFVDQSSIISESNRRNRSRYNALHL
jgi:hypothetical protein